MDDLQTGLVSENSTVALLNKSEIDQQIATAHKYPRSIKRFRDETLQMVTLNENVAAECIYALPRGGKTIEGASARFAEVVASAWGNSRAGARVIDDRGEFVTAQGVFHDLEKNVAITYEVQRRITDKSGRRFNADMITVTANAACSIALRNAILKGVPKAFWSDMYEAARQTVMGDFTTLANRRADALKAFQSYGVLPEQVYAKLEVAGVEDITLEHLVTLRGLLTAIKDGDTTPEETFGAAPQGERKTVYLSDDGFKKLTDKHSASIKSGEKVASELIAWQDAKKPEALLTKEQKETIASWEPKASQPAQEAGDTATSETATTTSTATDGETTGGTSTDNTGATE